MNYNLDHHWQPLGPTKKPLEDKRQSATGIGPVEFIRASEVKEGWLLAGSINGGLFYSKDGGEQWISAGSEEWHYSACGWAEFNPKNEEMWFASSCATNDNGQAGLLGHHGGIYRTVNAGLDWELVANKDDFNGSEYLQIFGFKFHPKQYKRLFVYTSEGLYQTVDCTAENIRWERITNLAGWIFDIDFTESHMYISHMQFGKWSVYTAPLTDLKRVQQNDLLSKDTDEKIGITFEPYQDQMLILVNYTRKADVLLLDNLKEKQTQVLLNGQRVVFGTGRTMANSPYRPNELMLGYGTTMKRWNLMERAETDRMKGGYHVDLEYILYDPFDSMKVYIATHGGVYTSFDHCQSWVSTSNGLNIAEVEALAVSEIDPNVMAIGCYHDGSSYRADWNNNGVYEWKNINGGDGLVPIIPKDNPAIVYTSNQFTGGGIYMSKDSGRTKVNIHTNKSLTTSGWQMSAVLHPIDQELLFFNYAIRHGKGKNNVEIARTRSPLSRDTVDRITNFQQSHQIEKYSVYGIYNSEDYPNQLYIHLIEFTKDEKGNPLNVHRVFRTDDCTAPAPDVINSWYEVEIPRSDWIASIVPSPESRDVLYIAYVAGIAGTELTTEDFGLIYNLKYQKGSGKLVRELDITRNIPFTLTGRYNIALDGNGGMFFGTRFGLYYGTKRTLKGTGYWKEVGHGIPHCKIHGVYFNKKENSLTIGMYGRGVWRYFL